MPGKFLKLKKDWFIIEKTQLQNNDEMLEVTLLKATKEQLKKLNRGDGKMFRKLFDLQKEFNGLVHQTRPRTETDIKNSLMAETLEWLQTTRLTFKTWDKRTYTKEQQLEEFSDILSFIFELSIFRNESINFEKTEEKFKDFKKLIRQFDKEKCDKEISELTNVLFADSPYFLKCSTNEIFISFMGIAIYCDYSLEEIEQAYLIKREKNIKRITGEWNG